MEYGLKIEKDINDFKLILSLNETINQLTMASNACWHGDVLRRKDGYGYYIGIEFEVEGDNWKEG